MNRVIKIVKQLQQFGMSEKEAAVYIALSELGPSSIQEISKHSQINRSTTHVIAESLKKQGFIGETRKGRKRILFIEDIDQFRQIVKDEKFNLELKEMSLKGLIPALQMLHPTQKELPKVRFYEGEEGFYDVCQRSLDKAENEILFLGSSEDFHTVATKEYNKNYYVPERMKKGIKIKMLVFNSPEAMELKEGDKDSMRETRFLPNDFFFRSTVFIYGNEFSMITSKVPFLGVVIQSKELSNCMSGMFNTLWHFVAE